MHDSEQERQDDHGAEDRDNVNEDDNPSGADNQERDRSDDEEYSDRDQDDVDPDLRHDKRHYSNSIFNDVEEYRKKFKLDEDGTIYDANLAFSEVIREFDHTVEEDIANWRKDHKECQD